MSQHPEIPGRLNPEFPRHYGDEPVFQNYRVVIEIAGKKESTIFKGRSEAEVKASVQRYLDKLRCESKLLSMTHVGYVA